jgi:cobalt/nickel transport system permease protein
LSLLCLISLVLALLSKIPLRNFVLRTTFFIPVFAAVISLPVLFLTRGHPIFSADISALTLSITSEGLQRFLVFTVRVWFCVASLTLLILSTGFDGMLKLLASLRVPCLVVQLFSLTYRYFFVSIHEVQRVLIAREARTYVNRSTMNFEGLKNLGTILATLFIRTYERSERVYMAMKSRGFEIGNSHKSSLPSLHLRDVLFAVSTIIALSLLAVS